VKDHLPRVSIGLPVYNGEDYLAEAVDSILAQTFEAFELILSDNASTDATEEICRGYETQDPRVRYFRSPTNRGAAWNYNNTVHMANSSEYFKWAAHDDTCAPEYLRKCVEVLDRDPEVVLCHTTTIDIDAQGQFSGKTKP